tara:strand:+ start:1641 stop:1862 length:222 start_codon:yes stop_codon:yes gene_type:complete
MTTEPIEYLEARIKALDAAYKTAVEERDLAFSALCNKFLYVQEVETKTTMALSAIGLEKENSNLIKYPEHVRN